MKAKRIAAKKVARKRKIVAKKRYSGKAKKVGAPNSDYLNAIAYLVSSEEKEVNLMVASTMGLVGE